MSVRHNGVGEEFSVIRIPSSDQTEAEEIMLCLQFPKTMPSVIQGAMRTRGWNDLEALLLWTEIRAAEMDAILGGEFMSRGLCDVARAIVGDEAARIAHEKDEAQIREGDLRSRWRKEEGPLAPKMGIPEGWFSDRLVWVDKNTPGQRNGHNIRHAKGTENN